jgi:hypothetical protein
MKPADLKDLACQLACPKGEQGGALATRMNEMTTSITARSIDPPEPENGEKIIMKINKASSARRYFTHCHPRSDTSCESSSQAIVFMSCLTGLSNTHRSRSVSGHTPA